MLEPSHLGGDLEARLAEIDRKLHAIQAELVPEREPLGQIAALTELHAKLLSSMQELLTAYQDVLAHEPGPGGGVEPSQPDGLGLSAGPFASTQALRAFEHALSRLPGVRDVAVRGYEGSRAIFDVQLSE